MRASLRRSAIHALIATTRGPFGYAGDGGRLGILRPRARPSGEAWTDQELASRAAEIQAGLPEAECVFVGWLSADGKRCLNDAGKDIGAPKRGDALVTFVDDDPGPFRPSGRDLATPQALG
jgi:hypothetical protein